jgi:Na+-driven multidrug efflux pump
MDKLDGPTGLSMRLENIVARISGRDDQSQRNTQGNQWIVGALIGGIALLLAVLSFVVKTH